MTNKKPLGLLDAHSQLVQVAAELEEAQAKNPGSDYGYYSERLDAINDSIAAYLFAYNSKN